MSVSTAFSMRYCIRNELFEIINFSPQNLINCLSGCQGEFPDIAWNYLNNSGISTDNCLSYKGYGNTCDLKCDNNNIKFNKYYAGKTKFLEDEKAIKKEILTNGPVTSMMNLYNDYFNYKSGIYIHNNKYQNVLGYHSITLMGWGIEDGIKYWLIQDSYGKSKGENGFIKIKIGDDCGAGATAFCDEIDGKYNDYEEDTNKTIINNGHEILYATKYFLIIFSLFLFIF
jgi:cathepsin B